MGIDGGSGVWIVYSGKPQSGEIDLWPATERQVRKALGWSEGRLLQVAAEYLKAHHCPAGLADYLLCRILNECERRLGQSVSEHPFTEEVEAVLGRESLVKNTSSAVDPEKIITLLKDRYHLGDPVIVGRARDVTSEVVRLLRPILAGFRRHSKFLYFEVDNEPSGERQRTQEVSCRFDYTVILAHFAQPPTPITLCVFGHGCPQDRENAYYILATHHPKIIDYLRNHVKGGA